MPLSTFAFTPAQGFRDSSFAPTDPPSEAALRDTMQDIPDQLRDALNGVIATLNSTTDGASGADNVAATPISGVTGDSVQEILESLYTLTQTLLPFPDGSVTNEKLATDVKVGSLSILLTTIKTSVVGAINELFNNKLGKTEKADDSSKFNGWRIYSDVSQLSLTGTPTVEQIIEAMPDLSFYNGAIGTNPNFPVNLGNLEIFRLSEFCVSCKYSINSGSSVYNTWEGSYVGSPTPKFTGWKPIILNSSVTTTINTGFASGWSGTITTLKNHNNLVELTLNLTSTTDISFANVYTLAVGLRPITGSNGALFGLDSSGLLVSGSVLDVSINTDGTILIFNITPSISGAKKVFNYKIMYYTA